MAEVTMCRAVEKTTSSLQSVITADDVRLAKVGAVFDHKEMVPTVSNQISCATGSNAKEASDKLRALVDGQCKGAQCAVSNEYTVAEYSDHSF